MAVVFPVGVEVFANAASCIAAGSSGTTNPAAGTTESWTVSTGSTSFPVAQNTVFPSNYFFVRDPADTTNEIVLVYNNNSSGSPGTSWSVQRGMSGACVAHATGATWVQVIAPYTLGNFKQQPGAATSAVTVGNSATELVLASFQPQAGECIGGSAWEAVAFGTMATGNSATHILQFALYWGGSGSVGGTYTVGSGAPLCKILTGTNAVAMAAVTTFAAGSSFDVNGSIALLSATTATANLNLFWNNAANLTTAQATATATNATAGGASSATAVTISGDGPIFLTAKWGAIQAATTLTATAPMIYRMA